MLFTYVTKTRLHVLHELTVVCLEGSFAHTLLFCQEINWKTLTYEHLAL